MSGILLYHAGLQPIPQPDLSVGRRNADFGQGFYLSADESFCRRWAKNSPSADTWLNRYALCTDGLAVKRFQKDAEWFDYIFANRAGRPDALAAYDIIVGPVANDILYDTWGILTSGFLRPEQALPLLMLGPVFEQTVIKTGKALAALRFETAVRLPEAEIAASRESVRQEEKIFQEQFAATLSGLLDTAGSGTQEKD